MTILTRPLRRNPHAWRPGVHVQPGTAVARGGTAPLILPGPDGPLMRTGNGGYVPAAMDPADPRTWRTQVVFT